MRFWTAWQLLTVMSSLRRSEFTPEALGKSLGLFPLVGLLLGAILLGLDMLLGLFLPFLLVNVLLLIVLVLLTGALHIDGFIDTCDGFAVKSSMEEKLKAMRDSRVGGFGVVGGCCLLLAKLAALIVLPEGLRASALILMPLLSRWGIVYAVFAFPPARREGMGWAIKQGANWQGMAVATVISLAALVILLGWWGVLLGGALCLVLLLFSKYLCSRFGGLSGDSYGAVDEFAEVAVLVLVSIVGGLGCTAWLGASL